MLQPFNVLKIAYLGLSEVHTPNSYCNLLLKQHFNALSELFSDVAAKIGVGIEGM